MTLVWLLVWLIAGVPTFGGWSPWLIALVVCIVVDALARGAQA